MESSCSSDRSAGTSGGEKPGDPDAVLGRHFGYPSFRPGQRDLVDAVLTRRDALGILPTGGGKSVCYQVPALMLGGLTIVVSPLVSLMTDQVRRAEEAGLPAATMHAGLDRLERNRVETALRDGVISLLLVAPERFASPRFQQLLPHLRVALFTVDEAHCISMWGHDFRPAYRELAGVRRALGSPVMALTATATPRVRREIEESLEMRDPLRVIGSFDRSNLRWAVIRVGPGAGGRGSGASQVGRSRGPASLRREKEVRAFDLVRRFRGARLVYASTRGRVEAIRNALARQGIRAEAYHAGLHGGERSRVQAYFMTDAAPVVVATNAFGMGIDRPDVRLVVHDQLPGSIEDYYQEAGRAGRDGGAALCVAFHHPSDGEVHQGFLDRTHPPIRKLAQLRDLASRGELGRRIERRRCGVAKLRGIWQYARSRRCRRAVLLGWFGESPSSGLCDGCDRCSGWSGVLDSVIGQ